MTEPKLTAKGRARRDALLDAALAVIEREGPAALTHRAVAAEAGLPTSAATYYFSDIDELLTSVLRRSVADYDASIGRLDPHDLEGAADAIRRYALEQRATAVAHYELLLLATRRPALRADAEAWYAILERDLGRAVPEDAPDAAARIRSAALAVDGLLLHMLWRGEPASHEGVRAALAAALAPLSAGAGAATSA
ncbi:TetR family transcriptional regulator [Microcella putealis]|uniref:TetR family transcriptional regulator n=1 Tax=Microcella putealis TaxID=337005 RepID=A0A4V2EXE4_9MICO|nr:TetR family transcriptional regulator [Microcella putealis]RZS59200.1 TetR family transcriptional regulator [Microcella putealis]TQM24226.1 TetR family transcriptional regulator [Microcella putealis]